MKKLTIATIFILCLLGAAYGQRSSGRPSSPGRSVDAAVDRYRSAAEDSRREAARAEGLRAKAEYERNHGHSSVLTERAAQGAARRAQEAAAAEGQAKQGVIDARNRHNEAVAARDRARQAANEESNRRQSEQASPSMRSHYPSRSEGVPIPLERPQPRSQTAPERPQLRGPVEPGQPNGGARGTPGTSLGGGRYRF